MTNYTPRGYRLKQPPAEIKLSGDRRAKADEVAPARTDTSYEKDVPSRLGLRERFSNLSTTRHKVMYLLPMALFGGMMVNGLINGSRDLVSGDYSAAVSDYLPLVAGGGFAHLFYSPWRSPRR